MTVWAASTFNNELDVLEIRLETLDEVVDRFVLAEATVTQRGNPKELYFEANKKRYAKWLDRIDYIVVDDMPPGEGYECDWIRERFQRNQLARVLENCGPGDRILISDLDEIPYPEALEDGLNRLDTPGHHPVKFLMDMFVYRLNWRWLDRGCLIGSTAAVFRAEDLPMRLIHDVLLGSNAQPVDAIAGWHLSYQGTIEMIRRKMTEMADNFYEQLVTDDLKAKGMTADDFLTDEWIQGSMDTGRDIYARTYRPSEWVDIDQMPPCVQADPLKYAHLMVPMPRSNPEGPRCSCGGVFDLDGVLAHYPKCQLYGLPGERRVEDLLTA